MPTVTSIDDLRFSDTASRFEGRDHGSTVSIFVTHHPPGTGVKLHRHPYEETFVVREGVGTFTVDGEQIEVPEGHILVVPAGAAHGFVNSGDTVLRQVTVHPSDHVVQEWVE
jgi:quercetin dioxygenase-like cupin family protein